MKLIPYLLILSSASAFSGEYLVKLKPGTSLKSFGMDSKALKSEFSVLQGNFAVVEATESQVYGLQNASSNIEYIEPNYTYNISRIADSSYGKQWGLNNTGRNSDSNWIIFGKKGMDVGAEKAWEITTGSKNIKIAVIDTGVDYKHEDLKNNIMINEAELNGLPGVDDDGNGYIDDIYGYDFANNDNDPMDGHGHGTHCAGVIGASHNDIGVRGVMAQVQILPVQFLTANGGGTLEGAIKAINYAISRGVNIMSNSWGGGGASQALEEAIALAEEHGILFVAAAGNESSNNDKRPTIPATIKLDNVVSVGSIDGRGKKSNFSNYGEKSVHIFAPGSEIYSTIPNNKYKKMSGTSMATPFVSGVAGLIWANEPNLTYKEVKERMMKTAKPGTDLSGLAQSELVDAYRALKN